MNIRHYLELLLLYRRTVIGLALAVGLAAAAGSTLMLLASPIYKASANVSILPTQAELTIARQLGGGGEQIGTTAQTHIEYLLSRPVAEATLQRLSEVEQTEEEEEEKPWLVVVLKAALKETLAFARYWINIASGGEDVELDPRDAAIADIQSSLSVELVEGSFILRIIAQSATPAGAARLANLTAESYLARSKQVASEAATAMANYLRQEIGKRLNQLDPEGIRDLRNRLIDVELSRNSAINQIRMIDPAIPPLRPAYPNPLQYTLAGFVLGGTLGILIILAMDALSSTVKTSVDMSRVVGSNFLGRVPRSLGALGGEERVQPTRDIKHFAAHAGARIGIFDEHGRQMIRVIGTDTEVARTGALAIAIAYAYNGVPVELALEDGTRRQITNRSGSIELCPGSAAGVCPSGVLVSIEKIGASPRTDPEPVDKAASATTVVDLQEATAAPVLSWVIVAMAAGQVQEELVEAMSLKGQKRLFLLVV